MMEGHPLDQVTPALTAPPAFMLKETPLSGLQGDYRIHPSALIHPSAKIAKDVIIGPFSIIEGDVSIEKSCIIAPYVQIKGHTTIGEGNHFFQDCIVGESAQSKFSHNPRPMLEIGHHNVFREHMTMHGSMHEGQATRIGSHNFLMAHSHIGHDCIVGDHIVFSNYMGLAGHVIVEDYAFVSGLSGVHQFGRVGGYAMVGGVSKIAKDVPPFMMTDGNPASVVGLNIRGMKRAGFSEKELRAIKGAYKLLYRSHLLVSDAIKTIEDSFLPTLEDSQARKRIEHLLRFCKETKRGIMAAG